MYLPHTECRACGYGRPGAQGVKLSQNESLIPVFNLGLQPLANDFTGPHDERAGYAPLQVMYCPRCTLGQLSVVVKPEVLYQHYSYVTSSSEMMARHFQSLADLVAGEAKGNRMLEVGSNDGRMLQFFAARGMEVTGIDPAQNLAQIAESNGIRTVVGLFNPVTAEEASQHKPFDIVMARHVFCHCDCWSGFINSLSGITHADSLVCIEAPYACDMLENGEFDTIYHEHTSYMTIRAMQALLKDTDFELYRLDHYPIHGGALLLSLRRREGRYRPAESVSFYQQNEKADLEAWHKFAQKADANVTALKEFVALARQNRKTVCGFGASAKSTVWISRCGFTRKDLSFITDNTVQKHWKLSPGTDIPITDEGALLRELPDYAVIFCWNFLSECVEKNQKYLESGGNMVVPIPTLKIIGKDGESTGY